MTLFIILSYLDSRCVASSLVGEHQTNPRAQQAGSAGHRTEDGAFRGFYTSATDTGTGCYSSLTSFSRQIFFFLFVFEQNDVHVSACRMEAVLRGNQFTSVGIHLQCSRLDLLFLCILHVSPLGQYQRIEV